MSNPFLQNILDNSKQYPGAGQNIPIGNSQPMQQYQQYLGAQQANGTPNWVYGGGLANQQWQPIYQVSKEEYEYILKMRESKLWKLTKGNVNE
jgi:hypothetical protein